ncbi:small multi-drug export protein [Candidatus Woesearchaeota archaeon]|nr:small multi-drug export protein [Candidatus Woesearchaeota archaeon]
MNNTIIKALILTATPSIELRGSIPYVLILKSSLIIVGIIVLFNIIIGLVTYLLAGEIINIGKKIPLFKKYWHRYIERIHRKAKKNVKKWHNIRILGIAAFIAIPLPGTGAYTGAIAAHLLGMDTKEFIIAESIGVTIAGIIVTIITLGVIGVI